MPNLEHYAKEARTLDPLGAILTNLAWLVGIPMLFIHYGPAVWVVLRDYLGTDRLVFHFLMCVPTTIFLFALCAAFMVADFCLPTSVLTKYKMQPNRLSVIDKANYVKAWKVAVWNSCVVVPVLSVFFVDIAYPLVYGSSTVCFPAMIPGEVNASDTTGATVADVPNLDVQDCTLMPGVSTFVFGFVFFGLFYDFMFYWAHRFLHLKNVFGFNLYGYIHKRHHEFTSPFAIACVYAHSIEHMLANVTPLMLGPLIAKAHPLVTTWWVMYGLYHTAAVHSGYHCWWLPSPLKHDWHHERFEENYSSMGIWDGLCKTNVEYLRNQKLSKGEKSQ